MGLALVLALSACEGSPKGCAVTVDAVDPGLYGPYDREPPAEPPRQAAPITRDTPAMYFAWAFPVVSAGDQLVLEISPVNADGYTGPADVVVENPIPAPQSQGWVVVRPEGGGFEPGSYRATLRIEDNRVGVVDFEVTGPVVAPARRVPPRQTEGSGASPSGGSN